MVVLELFECLVFFFMFGSLDVKLNVVDVIYILCEEDFYVKIVVVSFFGVMKGFVNFFKDDLCLRVV